MTIMNLSDIISLIQLWKNQKGYSMTKFNSVLFDLDGTLTDSQPGIIDCAGYAFSTLGYPVPDTEELRTFIGPPLSLSFARYGMNQDIVEKAITAFRARYADTGKFKNEVYPGIEDLLHKLKDAGYHLFVATSKPEPLAKEILAHFHLDSYFDEIAGASLDRSRESKQAVIAYLLNKKEVRNPVMVGDTDFDVTGAAKHNIPCIAVTWGYGNIESMTKAGAYGIVSSMDELFQLIHQD